DVVKQGCTIRELVEHRIEKGTFFNTDPERYIADLTAALLTDRRALRKTLELDDGRVVAVLSQPMADGGWVVTHECITERHRADQELQKTRNFLDTVIENVPATIIVKDAQDLRYVLINRAGEEYYGIARDKMIGRTSRDVFPKSDADFIETNDRHLVETCSPQFSDAHPVETPGNGSRMVTSRRLPILGQDGVPQYLVTVIQDVTERKRAEARIAHLAHYDSLTDLPNRAAFNERFAATLEQASAVGDPFALMSIDLDRFKEVNDVFGHVAGDALLRALSERLVKAADGAFLAPLGGDEVAMLGPEG